MLTKEYTSSEYAHTAPPSPKIYSLTISQWMYLLSFFTSAALQDGIASLPGPLFPKKAEEKGVGYSVYGGIMGINGFTIVILATFVGVYIDRIGVRKVYIMATVVNGMCSALFGLLDTVNSYYTFVGLAFCIKAIEGISVVGNQYTIYTLCSAAFPGKFGTAISIVETGFLMGSMLGPFVGETLFQHIGYIWTFMTFGLIQIGIGLLSFVYLPEVPKYQITDLPVKDVLKGYKQMFEIPSICLFVVAYILVEFGARFVSTILEPGLREHHLSNIGVGLMFLYFGTFNILTPLWGLVLDKISRAELIVALSFFVLCVAIMILGPLPFVAIHRTHTTTICALLMFGFGQGMLCVSTAVNFQLEVEDKSAGDSRSVSQMFVPIVLVAGAGFGGMVGSSTAGILFENLGFAHALLFLFATHFTMGLLTLAYMTSRKCRPRAGFEPELDELKPIIKIN